MNTPPSPSPDALAAAMRDGLDGRRFFRNPVPFPAIPTPPANLLPQLVVAVAAIIWMSRRRAPAPTPPSPA